MSAHDFGICEAPGCQCPAICEVQGIAPCIDHLDWAMAERFASLSDALQELQVNGVPLGARIRGLLVDASTKLRAAQAFAGLADPQLSQSLAAVALQVEDLLDRLPVSAEELATGQAGGDGGAG